MPIIDMALEQLSGEVQEEVPVSSLRASESEMSECVQDCFDCDCPDGDCTD
jgi:hypothetical protein